MVQSAVTIEAKNVLTRIAMQSKRLKDMSKVLDKAAAYQESQILKRTARGVDANGAKFKGYSEGYKKTRRKKGRPTGRVDLDFTGEMKASLTHKTSRNKAELYFASDEESKKAYFNNKKRKFFGFGRDDSKKISEIILKEIIK